MLLTESREFYGKVSVKISIHNLDITYSLIVDGLYSWQEYTLQW